MVTGEQNASQIMGELKGMCDDINQLTKALLGNGQPGVLDRLTRYEEATKKNGEQIMRTSEQVDKLASSISQLSKIVEGHVSDKDNHGPAMFLKNPKYIGYVILAAILIHSIIEQGGPVLSNLLALFAP